MRVLGGLRNRYKLIGFVLLFLVGSSAFSINTPIKSYKDFLRVSKDQGAEYKKFKAQFQIDELNADSLVSLYNWSVSGGLTRQDAQSPPTSPFAPAGESSRENINLRVDKKTAFGVDPFVQILTNDQALNFPGRSPIEFQTASLEVGFRADIMKLLFSKSNLLVFKQYGLQKEIAQIALKNFERSFDAELSKLYFQTLKSYKQLEILKTQCSEYNRLQRTSASRYKRRLIREKDFLSIEVLYQGCSLDKDFAKNNFEMDKVSLLKKAGLPLNTKVLFQNTEFLKTANTKEFRVSSNLDYQLAEKTLEATKAYAASQKSRALPELSFDYSLVSQASESGVGSSIDETFGFDLRTHNIGLNLRYEFGASTSKIEAKKALAEQSLRSLELEKIKQSLVRDDEKIKKQSAFLKLASDKSLKLVKLQKRKSVLFKKDFENGRGGIRDLVEAQVNYLKSLETSLNYKYSQTISQIDRYLLSGEDLEGSH